MLQAKAVQEYCEDIKVSNEAGDLLDAIEQTVKDLNRRRKDGN